MLDLSPEEKLLTMEMVRMWNLKLFDFQLKAMEICYMIHCAWMPQIFQHMFNVIFAVKNKRSPHLANLGNFLDFVLIMDGLLYIFTAYRGWRWDTFLGNLDNE